MRYRMLLIMTAAQIGGTFMQQGFGALAPFVVDFYHVNKAQLGLAFTALNVGAALTVGFAGIFVDRFGERRVTAVSGVTMAACLFLAALVPWYPWLIAWLFVFSIAYSVVTPAGGRSILGWFQRDRGFAMGIRLIGSPLGAGLGGLVLPALALKWGYSSALAGAGLLALVLTGGLPLFYRDPEGGPPPGSFSNILGNVRTIVTDRRAIYFTVACIVLIGAQQISNAFLSLTAIQSGRRSLAIAALIFAASQGSAAVGRIAWGWVSDVPFRGDRATPIALICCIVSLAAFGLAWTRPGGDALLWGGALLIGFAGSGWNGLFSAAMAEIGGQRYAASAIGIGLTLMFASGAVAPVLFGAFADAHSLSGGWMWLGVVSLLGIVPALLARAAFARRAAL